MALGFKHTRTLHLAVPRISIVLYSMFTVQASAHPSLHGLYKHDSDSVTSSGSDQDTLFDMSSTASTCTVPHKSEFSVPSRWTPMLISHKEPVRYLWRIWKGMQNSVWRNDNSQKRASFSGASAIWRVPMSPIQAKARVEKSGRTAITTDKSASRQRICPARSQRRVCAAQTVTA